MVGQFLKVCEIHIFEVVFLLKDYFNKEMKYQNPTQQLKNVKQ